MAINNSVGKVFLFYGCQWHRLNRIAEREVKIHSRVIRERHNHAERLLNLKRVSRICFRHGLMLSFHLDELFQATSAHQCGIHFNSRLTTYFYKKKSQLFIVTYEKRHTALSLGSVEYCSWSPRDVHRLCDYCVGTWEVKCAFVSTKHAKTHYILVDIHRFSCVSKIQRFYANTTRMKASRM